ncbi:MAG: DUF503 domain-containing protein [Cellvibrionaceae bacterium]|nr:DUF503 domain-containing protein [Cellvibrionaceae bacterium]
MFIAILTLQLHLEGCFSLKEKRGRIGGLRDKFGRSPSVAVCESGEQDQHQQAEYIFTVVGLDKGQIKSQISAVINHCNGGIDAVLADHKIEWL